MSSPAASSQQRFLEHAARRILILDGAMGTMIQRDNLTEADYRGVRFADWPSDVRGNNDLLLLTQPQIIREIHAQYLAAGAVILETNTFNANTWRLRKHIYQKELGGIQRFFLPDGPDYRHLRIRKAWLPVR